jgi:hypothetical protein
MTPADLPNANNSPPSRESIGILTRIASMTGLIGTALFFAGYTYRSAYFDYFQVDLLSLDLPPQSYITLPIQIFFGTPQIIFNNLSRALLYILGMAFLTGILQLINFQLSRLRQPNPNRPSQRRLLSALLKWFANLSNTLNPFLQEIVIVIGIMAFLFGTATYQGILDAQRDAYHQTSTLPTFALVSTDQKIALGRQLHDSTADPPLFDSTKKTRFRIFGDRQLFDRIYRREDNETSISENPRIWRLLINRNKYIYVFTGISGSPPSERAQVQRPLTLAIQEASGEQQIILGSPQLRSLSKPKK